MVNTVSDPIGDPLTGTTPGAFHREYSVPFREFKPDRYDWRNFQLNVEGNATDYFGLNLLRYVFFQEKLAPLF